MKTRISSPARCTWIRAPSSFHSTDASPNSSTADPTSSSLAASIGLIARSTSSPTPASAARPSPRASAAVRPRSPFSINARRTAAAGTSAARAIAAAMTPSSAPWRSSPSKRRRMNSPSDSVAAPSSSSRAWRRRPADPGPLSDATSSIAVSSPAIVSDGSPAGVTSTVERAAQPTPTLPCRGSPVRNPTAAASSSSSRRRSSSASAWILKFGKRLDLGVSARGGTDRVRGGDDVREEHRLILSS